MLDGYAENYVLICIHCDAQIISFFLGPLITCVRRRHKRRFTDYRMSEIKEKNTSNSTSDVLIEFNINYTSLVCCIFLL